MLEILKENRGGSKSACCGRVAVEEKGRVRKKIISNESDGFMVIIWRTESSVC